MVTRDAITNAFHSFKALCGIGCSTVLGAPVLLGGDALRVKMTVGFAEHFFNTTLHRYTPRQSHVLRGQSPVLRLPFSRSSNNDETFAIIRHASPLRLPAILRDQVDMVVGLSRFPALKLRAHEKQVSTARSTSHDPTNVPYTTQLLYSIPHELYVVHNSSQAAYAQVITLFSSFYFVLFERSVFFI